MTIVNGRGFPIESHTEFLKTYFENNPEHLADVKNMVAMMNKDECFCVDASLAKKRFLLKGPGGWPRRRLGLRTLLEYAHTGKAEAVMPLPACGPNCVNVHHTQALGNHGFSNDRPLRLGNLATAVKARVRQ